jgi:hypothetical protein
MSPEPSEGGCVAKQRELAREGEPGRLALERAAPDVPREGASAFGGPSRERHPVREVGEGLPTRCERCSSIGEGNDIPQDTIEIDPAPGRVGPQPWLCEHLSEERLEVGKLARIRQLRAHP